MTKTNEFVSDVRECAVKMVQEQRRECPSREGVSSPWSPKRGYVPQTQSEWAKRAEVDAGTRECVTTAMPNGVKAK